jgi:hypothetical protein
MTFEEIKPIVGQGHPLDPNRGKLLSREDERRIDEKGRPVVEGKLWGDASSGAYLVMLMTADERFQPDRPLVGLSMIDLGPAFRGAGSTKLWLGASMFGKPVFSHDYVGAALELPDDLGKDAHKRQYVIEWLVATFEECFAVRQVSMPPVGSALRTDLGYALAAASQKAIEATRL